MSNLKSGGKKRDQKDERGRIYLRCSNVGFGSIVLKKSASVSTVEKFAPVEPRKQIRPHFSVPISLRAGLKLPPVLPITQTVDLRTAGTTVMTDPATQVLHCPAASFKEK
ncbi:hypothetical protein [Pseudomonas sp. MPB23]|uniref:hypothetical protein n=1 Tax=Pseudomonas sp. MPB23 TaxID=3388490 RepID=UPI0039849D9B